LNEFAAYLTRSGQMPPPEVAVNDLRPEEVKMVADFLIDHKKAGQFKTFWPDVGFIASLHITREVVVSDMWQPGVFFARRANVPMYYADLDFNQGGYRSWYVGENPGPAVTPEVEKSVLFFLDWRLGGWYQVFNAAIGYTNPSWISREVKEAMGPEYWDWAFAGKGTYQSIDEMPFIELAQAPRLIKQALFTPEKYSWSTTPGTPHADGNLRDGGSLGTRDSKIGTIQIFGEHAEQYVEEWKRFKAA
ncbi:MAG: hypothetical protein ACE5PO_07505, partial [Candidatus Bathyarchaeia archaeon]